MSKQDGGESALDGAAGSASRRELRRGVPDHEFPHIVEVDGEHLRCICGAMCDLSAWLTWLPLHGKACAPSLPNA